MYTIVNLQKPDVTSYSVVIGFN